MDFFRHRSPVLCALASVAALALSLPSGLRAQVPTQTQSIPPQTLSLGGAALNLDLRSYFSEPGVTGQVVQFDTVMGKFNVELFANDAPASVNNFLAYVADTSYSGTLIHRSAALGANNGNRIIQGGGYVAATGNSIARKAPIALEYKLANSRGTLAFARTSALNSATSEWFFNVDDNTTALGQSNGGGYAVFGHVLGTGMSVVDAIAGLPVFNLSNNDPTSPFVTVPLRDVASGQTAVTQANLVVVNSMVVAPIYPTPTNLKAVIEFAVVNNNSSVVTATLSGSTLVVTPVGAGTSTLSLRAADANGNFISTTVDVTVALASSAPVITTQPVAHTVATGSTAVFNVAASGVPTPSYQWRKDGGDIFGATSATFVIQNASAASVGAYSVFVTNSTGNVTSSAANLAVTSTNDPGRLINLSVLTDIPAAGSNFTVATVVGGAGTSGPKPLVVRVVGPSLAAITGSSAGLLSAPKLDLFLGSSALASNSGWGGGATLATAMASVGAFAFTGPTSLDAAIFQQNLTSGSYSVIASGVGGATGLCIAEIYDATPAGTFTSTTPRLINVSVLKNISAGGSVTLGFVVVGSVAKTVLIRAIGPGLAAILGSTSGTLGDPQLTLFNSSSASIATNDDWGADAQLSSAGSRVGAFAIGSVASKDAILITTLAPGLYTARANGGGGTSGTAIVEVYEVP